MYCILHYSEYSDCTFILTATKSRGGEVVYAPANAKNQIDLLNHVISSDKKSQASMDKMFANFLLGSFAIAKEHGCTPEEKKRIEAYENTGVQRFHELLKPKGPFVTLIHSDCWNNNLMFQ